MKKSVMACALLSASVAVSSPTTGKRSNDWHAWSVNDANRPDPVKVMVPENGIPSDAIVLFDGTVESIRKYWRSDKGTASKWTVKDGAFVCTPGSGSAVSAEKFADCQLHVEWMTPNDDLYGWGNSGVILGAYEIQIIDSSAIEPSRSPFKPANYADGQAGAVYGYNPCLVNPCRKVGEWQSFDIIYHPPTFEGKRLVDPGDITVFFNGVLVQDAWKLEGSRTRDNRPVSEALAAAFPIRLQDHGHPVPFRNVWVRRIPSRTSDTVNGGPFVKCGDVAKLRHRLAGESLEFAKKTDDPAERFIRLWESFCYEPDRNVRREIDTATTNLIAAIKAKDPRVTEQKRFGAVRRFIKMLVSGQWIEKGTSLEETVDAFKAPPKPKSPNQRDI